MKKYQIIVPITEAVGNQTYEVEASSPEEALEKIKKGGGQFVEEEIEVQGLEWHAAFISHEESSPSPQQTGGAQP